MKVGDLVVYKNKNNINLIKNNAIGLMLSMNVYGLYKVYFFNNKISKIWLCHRDNLIKVNINENG